MERNAVQSNQTTQPNSNLIQSTVLNLGIFGLGSDPRTIFLLFGQHWFNFAAVIENAVIVIVFMFYVGPRQNRFSESETKNSTSADRRSGLSTVSRVYFIAIGFAELNVAIWGFLLNRSLLYLPYWLSGGRLEIDFSDSGDWGCKSQASLHRASMNFTQYALTCLAFERMVAVTFPFRAKSVLNIGFTAILLIFVAGSYTLYGLVGDILVFKLIPNPYPSTKWICSPVLYNEYMVIFAIIYIIFNLLGFIFMLICTLVVAIRIMTLSRARVGIQAGQGRNTGLALREISSAVTMIALVAINLLVAIPTVISWDILVLYSFWAPNNFGNSLLYIVSHFIQELLVIPLCLHFFSYLARISAFCNGLRDLFTCRPPSLKSVHLLSSQSTYNTNE